MKKRKSLLTVLGTCTVACLASAFALLPVNATQAAADDKIAVSNVLMEEGAYVRLGNQSTNQSYVAKSGLRFVMFVNKAYYDGLVSAGKTVEVGMYVAHENFYDAAKDNTDLSDENSIPAYSRHVVMQNFDVVTSDVTAEEVYEFAVVQPDIDVKDYGDQLSANGYIKVDGAYTFASNVQTRSIAQTASNALLAGETNDGLKAFVDGVVTEDNFAIENTTVKTDLYKTAEPSLGEITLPANVTPIWTSSDKDVVAVDAQGNLTRGTKTGTATITATLGTKTKTATVTVNDPAPLIVDEDYKTVLNNNDVPSEYLTAEQVATEGIEGDYAGAAIRYNISNAKSNAGYNLTNTYSAEEIAAIKEDYYTVTMYVAVKGILTKSLNMNSNIPNLIAKAGCTGFGTTATWQKLTISIDDYVAFLNGKTTCVFAATADWSAATYAENVYFYVSDVKFDVFEKYIIALNDTTKGKIWNPDVGSTYIPAGTGELANFTTNGYTGGAKRFATASNAGWRYANAHTLEQLNIAKKYYTHVTLWFAVDNIASGKYYLENWSMPGGHISFNSKATVNNGGDKTLDANDNGIWQSMSISIDDYITMLTVTDAETGATSADTIFFFARTSANSSPTAVEGKTMYLYLGDVYFENITA